MNPMDVAWTAQHPLTQTQADHRAEKSAYYLATDVVDPRYRCPVCGRIDFEQGHKCPGPQT